MALAALLSSIALLAAAPAGHAALLQPAPVRLAQAEAPLSTTSQDPNIAASAEALANGDDPFPAGAPTDDYGFMGWCYGALAGHLDLYAKALPEVRRIEGQFPEPGVSLDKVMDEYKQQHAAGRKILDGYARALSVEEAVGHANGEARAAAVAKGREVWKGSAEAEPRQLAQLWMSWALPARCESTARRLAPSQAAQ